MKFIFFKKSYIITPEILDSFLLTNIAGSWMIFLLYSFLLGGNCKENKRFRMKCILEIKVERFLLPCSMNSYLKCLCFSFYISLISLTNSGLGNKKIPTLTNCMRQEDGVV